MGNESLWQERPKYYHFPYCKDAVGIRLSCKFSSQKKDVSLFTKKGDDVHLNLIDENGTPYEQDMHIDYVTDYPNCICFQASCDDKTNDSLVWLADICIYKHSQPDKDYVVLTRTFRSS